MKTWFFSFHVRSVIAAEHAMEDVDVVGQDMPVAIREAVFCVIDILEGSLLPGKMMRVTATGHTGPGEGVHASVSAHILDAPYEDR